MLTILRAIRLAAAIRSAFPDVPARRVLPASLAIVLEHGQHDPLLVATLAYGESRFDWRVVNARGCAGAMQVCGRGRYRTERASYAAGVRKLDEARDYCERRRTPTTPCLLAVYGSGPRGAREGLYRRPRLVLRRLEKLRRAMGGRPGLWPTEGAES